MKVHLINYAGSPIAAFSSRNKLLRSFTRRIQKKTYYQEIINDLKNRLQGIYVNEYDEKYKKISKESIQEILNMLSGEDYDYSLFTYEELRLCTNEDYSFSSLQVDKK